MEACDVTGCERPAERSVSAKLAARAGLKFEESMRRVHLCKEHYRKLKKETKELRQLESLGR
jgi:propanediol utilization protein